MHQKPLVGINADFREAAGNQGALTYICAGYYNAVIAAGGVPVILPPIVDEEDLNAVLDRLDAFVLVGGADLDPQRDGFYRHASVKPMASRREDFDRLLVNQIVERKLPVFGIGVGMQLLNIALGGELFFHIPEDFPHALPHRDRQDRGHRHGLEVVEGTVMERVFGDGEIRVNSMHHMAIAELAPAFIVSARCPDGVIEAIETRDENWFAMGTQFHPEADSASALDQRIFEEFIAGVTGIVPAVKMVA